jgi:hypothetical protein
VSIYHAGSLEKIYYHLFFLRSIKGEICMPGQLFNEILARNVVQITAMLKRYNKAILLNAIMCIITGIGISLLVLQDFYIQDHLNDYGIYYYASRVFIQGNPVNIYDAAFMDTTFNVFQYRYFPAILFIFYPLSLIPLIPSYLFFISLSFILNLGTFYLLLKISTRSSNDEHRPQISKMAMYFVIMTSHVGNYSAGQVASILAFLMVLSFYLFLTNHDLAGSFFIGVALVVKPVTIFVILFLLLDKNLKVIFKRGILIALALIPDLLVFLFVPGLLRGFIDLNFVYFTRTGVSPSISVSNVLVSLFGLPSTTVMLIGMAIMIPVCLFLLYKVPRGKMRVFMSFFLGLFTFFLIQPDVWSSQLLYLYPFVILAIPFIKTAWKKNVTLLILLFPILCDALGLEIMRLFLLPIVGCLEILLFLGLTLHLPSAAKRLENNAFFLKV